jgi:2-C-methyl-D-erythritol 2,4-cyclodiphosphate synthase
MKNCHQTGFGFDSHAFSTTGTLVLGGMKFSGTPALKGHSDGDAILHAIIDALLGAAGLGDIGDFFPDTDACTKGISSLILLKRVLSVLSKKKFRVLHVDITVVAEKPRFSAIKKTMQQTLARALSLPLSSVNIKAKTPEGLTIFSSKGGVAVWAVATVQQK